MLTGIFTLSRPRRLRRRVAALGLALLLALGGWAGRPQPAAAAALAEHELAGVWLVSAGPSSPAEAGGDTGTAILPGSHFIFDPARYFIANFQPERELVYFCDSTAQKGEGLVFSFRGAPVMELWRGQGGVLRLRNRGQEFELTRTEGDIAAIRDMNGLAGLWAVHRSTRGADVTSMRYARISNYPPRLDYESRWTGGQHRRTALAFSGEPAAPFSCRLPDSHSQERAFIAYRQEDGRLILADGSDQVVLSRSEEAELSDPELSQLDGYWTTDWEESKKHLKELPDGGLDSHALFFFRGVTPVTLAFVNLGGRVEHYAEPWNFDEEASYLPVKILDGKSYSLDYGAGGSRRFTLLDDDLLLVHYVEMVNGRQKSTADAVLRRIVDCRYP